MALGRAKLPILLLALCIVTVVLFELIRTRRGSQLAAQPQRDSCSCSPAVNSSSLIPGPLPEKRDSSTVGGIRQRQLLNESNGYILAFRHYEQQTQAMRNYLQLQCFGQEYGLRAVEPFFVQSFLAFPFNELLKGTELLRFRDIFDLDVWDKETSAKFGYHPIAKWSEFLQKAPRNVVVACIQYRNPDALPVPVPAFNFRTGCPKECFKRFDPALTFLHKYGFTLVQQACSNFRDYAGSVSANAFLENLLGKYSAREVTVLLSEFRGFFGLYRLPVLSSCGVQHHKRNVTILPSARIVEDARTYTSHMFQDSPYIAVLVRVERIVLHLHHNATACAHELGELLGNLSRSNRNTNYFLAMDVGKFGSRGARLHNLQPQGELFLKAVYHTRLTFDEWERNFEKFVSSTDAGYVANFQRVVAAKSECLVMVGAGGFQGQARDYYVKFHPDQRSQCIYKICASEDN